MVISYFCMQMYNLCCCTQFSYKSLSNAPSAPFHILENDIINKNLGGLLGENSN